MPCRAVPCGAVPCLLGSPRWPAFWPAGWAGGRHRSVALWSSPPPSERALGGGPVGPAPPAMCMRRTVDSNRGLPFRPSPFARARLRGPKSRTHARARTHVHHTRHRTPCARERICATAYPSAQGLSFMSMWVHIPLTRRSVCGDSEAAEEADHTVETWEAWNRPASPQPRKASSFGYRFALIVDRPSARPRPPAADAAKRCAAAAKRWPERLRRRERNGGFCFQRSARLVPARAFARGGWLCMPHTTRHAAANDPRQSRARTHARPLVLVFRALPTDRPGFKPRLPECGVCGVGWCCALTGTAVGCRMRTLCDHSTHLSIALEITGDLPDEDRLDKW